MYAFVLGALFGGFVTFVVMAIVSVNKTSDEITTPQSHHTETGGTQDEK